MANDDQAASALFSAYKAFMTKVEPRLPSSTGGNILLFGVHFVGICSRQIGFSMNQIELFTAIVADTVRGRTGRDPTAVFQKTLSTLSQRAMAHAIEPAFSGIPPTRAVFEGLSSDLLELAHERTPSAARIAEIAELLRKSWFEIQEGLTRPPH